MKGLSQLSKITVCLLLLLFSFCSASWAADQSGWRPEIKIGQWIQGEESFDSAVQNQELIVLEFFSTACPACRDSLQVLNKKYKKFRQQGITVIGISDEEPERLHAYIEQEKIGIPIAIDDNDKSYLAFMGAFNVESIPHSFVISGEGKILWHGFPEDGLEQVLTEISSGKFNFEAAHQLVLTKRNREKSLSLFSAYQLLSGYPEEADLVRALGTRIVDCIQDDLEALALMSIIFAKDYKDYPSSIQALEKAMAHPDGGNPALKENFIEVMQRVELSAPATSAMLEAVAGVQNGIGATQLENLLKKVSAANE